jgi:LPS O-antigen subunit length determinant protein (WzzB/FepE family)
MAGVFRNLWLTFQITMIHSSTVHLLRTALAVFLVAKPSWHEDVIQHLDSVRDFSVLVSTSLQQTNITVLDIQLFSHELGLI